jgi:hypothetical protein
MGRGVGNNTTYRLVELGAGLAACGLGLLLEMLATAGELALDLCGGLVDVGWEGDVSHVSQTELTEASVSCGCG